MDAEEARRLLRYDPETGDLYWRVNRRGTRSVAGDKAGAVSSHFGYVVVSYNYKHYMAHRIIWLMLYNKWPDQIDHIDHNRANNRLSNLRDVTHQENQKNCPKRVTNKSGVTGVCWAEREGLWRAHIMIDAKQIHIGYHADWFDAVCARKSAEHKFNFHVNHGR